MEFNGQSNPFHTHCACPALKRQQHQVSSPFSLFPHPVTYLKGPRLDRAEDSEVWGHRMVATSMVLVWICGKHEKGPMGPHGRQSLNIACSIVCHPV